MPSLYLDSSALFKLVNQERESPDLERFLPRFPQRASSVLVQVELARGLLRLSVGVTEALARCASVLASLSLLALDAPVLQRAATLPPPLLRSLDALHLASALSLADCAGMVTYDRRLLEAAAYHGLQAWSPGA